MTHNTYHTIAAIALGFILGAGGCDRAEALTDTQSDRLAVVASIVTDETNTMEWDESEVCSTPELIKRFKILKECKAFHDVMGDDHE